MPLQKLPEHNLDDVNQRRRARETLNKVLDHSFDDSKVQTDAETLAGQIPQNRAYDPTDVRRHGASKAALSDTTQQAKNRIALRTTILAVDADPTISGGAITIPGDCQWGYDITDPATWPDFSGTTRPIVVIDYSQGNSFAGYPTAYDGAQIRWFFNTPQTTATITFTAGLAGGATSGTLTANWAHATGPWPTTFSNGDVRYVTYTSGATTATWTGGLSSAVTATATHVNYGQHHGNQLVLRGPWNPGIWLQSDGVLDAPGGATRTALDNRRCQIGFGINGDFRWNVGQGTLVGPNYTEEELTNFIIEKIVATGDTLGNFPCFLVERKTGNQSFGFGGNVPVTSFAFSSISTGFDQMMIENIWDVQSRMFLRSSAGSTSDGGIGIDSSGATGGNLFLWFRSSGHAVDIDRVTRRVSIATALIQARVAVSYSASVSFNASDGNNFHLTVTTGTAFTINAPTNLVTGMRFSLMVRNTSGGAVGAITWNAVFKQAFVAPATGFSRTVEFIYDGTNCVEIFHSPTDVPN